MFILNHTCTVLIRQFDTMIYPEYKDKSRGFTSIWNMRVAFIIGAWTDHPRFSVPPSDKMRAHCLRIHLEPYKKGLLEGTFQANFDVHSAVEQFIDLYNCCYRQHYGTTWIISDWEVLTLKNVSCFAIVLDA